MKRRWMALGVATVAALGLTACGPQGSAGSASENYPTQNIEMLVGFAAGGHNDATARKFAEGLEEQLGQKVLVVNREGGGGSLAATEAATVAPDGHKILFAPTGAFTSTMLQQDVSYEIEDFRSIQPVAQNTFVVAVPADSPFETFEDLQQATGRLTYSAFGEGHPTHLIGAGIIKENDLAGDLVAFPGSPPALQAIVNGDVDFGIQDVTSALPRLESGEIRALAATTESAPDALGDVPSIAEFGLADYLFDGSQALVVPKDTPGHVVDKLTEAAQAAVKSEDFTQFMEDSGGTVPEVGGEEWFAEYMPTELERFRTLYADLGIQ
jgi:tripartite-type tricarboxylate transporter receptor subunit TctC